MSQILLSGSTGPTLFGTTIHAFSTTPFGVEREQNTGYVIFNELGQPSKIGSFTGDTIWVRNKNNNYQEIDKVHKNYLTGYTTVDRKDVVLNEASKKTISNRISRRVVDDTKPYKTYVLFEEHPINDIFYNVSIKKTFDTLDTFNVYNTLTNSTPIQQSNTGVVFGKLEAIQQLDNPLNPEEKVRIPLANVPIGVFNSSEEFPQTTSTDDNGNRLRLNFKPINNAALNLNQTPYSNEQSKNFDESFLLDSQVFDRIPDQYKLMTTTNQNGEFIIYNVPIGSQTIIFDVDLLKQGLTKEEVSLNFFPYPTNEDPNIDNVPHFFSRQIPIDVLPAWGDFQTGYTEVNISAKLDLRKWATYYFTPVSYLNRTLPSLPEVNIFAPLSIQVRDMTKPFFGGTDTDNLPPVELVTIIDNLDREINQELSWFGEFAQRKNSGEFRNDDFSILKLPANIYHPSKPSSYELEKNPSNPKPGSWYCGYQLKQFINNDNYRTTGLQKIGTDGSGRAVLRDHFNLNYNVGGDDENSPTLSTVEDDSYGTGVYSEPWSYYFPNEVQVPKVPSSPITGRDNARYSDGDLVGKRKNDDETLGGGYGYQQDKTDTAKQFSNKFSKRVTADFVYKYEQGISRDEEYASRLRSYDSSFTKVLNGEQYQRVEAGYGYFMRPQDWPKVEYGSYDKLVPTESEGSYLIGDGQQDLTLKMSQQSTKVGGRLDIYRILDPSPQNLISPDPSVVPTYFEIDLRTIYRRTESRRDRAGRLGYSFAGQNVNNKSLVRLGEGTSARAAKEQFLSLEIKIINNGDGLVLDPDNNPLARGQSWDRTYGRWQDIAGNAIRLQMNKSFDFNTFEYTKADYKIEFIYQYDGSEGRKTTIRLNDAGIQGKLEGEPRNRYKLYTTYREVNRRRHYSKKELCVNYPWGGQDCVVIRNEGCAPSFPTPAKPDFFARGWCRIEGIALEFPRDGLEFSSQGLTRGGEEYCGPATYQDVRSVPVAVDYGR